MAQPGARVQWRKFTFFDKDIVEENIEAGLGGAKPTCAVAEGGILVFGDASGNISLSDRNFRFTDRKYKAFRGEVRGLAYLFDRTNHRRQYVVAVGDDARTLEDAAGQALAIPSASFPSYMIKIFSTANMSRPLQTVPVPSSGSAPDAVVTAFAVLPDGSQIAIGFSNRTVLLFTGPFLREGAAQSRPVSSISLASAPRTGPVAAVTGLHFCELLSSKSNDRRVRLYAVFETVADHAAPSSGPPRESSGGSDENLGGIVVYDTTLVSSGAGVMLAAQRAPPHILDELGAGKNCSSLMKETSELVVGRSEGVFSYSVDDRGGAAGFEGEKQCVSTVGRYVLVAQLDDKTRRTVITIYDLRNKFISMSSPLPVGEKVSMVLHDGGMAYIVTTSGSLIRLRERDTASKLEVLVRKSLFPLAISLAAEEQCEASEIMKLYKMYGDHLYKRNDFDQAVVQYCNALGYIQPSYAVRKFLDPHRVNNLVTYLEKLRERGLATNDHVMLLLSCYAKTKDEEKITAFIESARPSADAAAVTAAGNTGSTLPSSSSAGSTFGTSGTLASIGVSSTGLPANFNVDTAVEVLRSAGFLDHALRMAVKFCRHDAYLSMQLAREPAGTGVDEALTYLTELVLTASSDELRGLIRTHGVRLLSLRPTEVTSLLTMLCTGGISQLKQSTGSSSGADLSSSAVGKAGQLQVEDVLHVFANDEKNLKVFLEQVFITNKFGLPSRVTDTLLELYLRDYSAVKQEAVREGNSREHDQYEALQTLEKKIMSILDGFDVQYDEAQALLLTHAAGYAEGEVFLLEKMLSVDLLMRTFMESKDEKGIFRVLRREGRKDPELYVQVLNYFVQQALPVQRGTASDDSSVTADDDAAEEERWDAVTEVLSLIDAEAALYPQQVISILASNPDLPLHVASRYIKKSLQDVMEDVATLEQDVITLSATIDNVVSEEATRSQSISSKGKASKEALRAQARAARRAQMQRNGGFSGDDEDDDDEEEEEDAELEEQEQAAERSKWESIKKAQQRRALDHEAFFAELEHSEDGFACIASSFGKATISN